MKQSIKKIIVCTVCLALAILTVIGCTPQDPNQPKKTEEPKMTEIPQEYYDSYLVENRYFIYRIWNFNISVLKSFQKTVDEVQKDGFNTIMIHVPWLHVEKKDKGDYSFKAFDAMFDYVIREKGMKAILSVDLTRRPSDRLLNKDCFMTNRAGELCSGGVAFDKCEISFNSEMAMSYAADFFGDICKHYYDLYGDGIVCTIASFSQYAETEYWCTDEYDYSQNAVSAFREYVKNRFETVEAMNKECGTSFADFESVEPPSARSTDSYGKIWYYFRTLSLKKAIDRLAKAQHDKCPGTKMGVQFGSVFDGASLLRGTYDFPFLCENVDVLWVDDGPTYNHTFSMDYARSNLPPTVWLANEIDGPTQVNASVANYLDQGLSSFQHGATLVNIANWAVDKTYAEYRDSWIQISDTWLDSSRKNLIPGPDSTELQVKLSDMAFAGAFDGLLQQYKELHQEDAFVRIRIINDFDVE